MGAGKTGNSVKVKVGKLKNEKVGGDMVDWICRLAIIKALTN